LLLQRGRAAVLKKRRSPSVILSAAKDQRGAI
jgi:hypothetical protein